MKQELDLLNKARKYLLSKKSSVRENGVRIVERLLSEDDPRAQYIVATWYLHGSFGYEEDLSLAKALLEKASEALIPEACYDLAVFIECNGRGRNKKREAFGFYLLAATLGDKDALDELARCLYWGVGAYKNEHIAGLLQVAKSKKIARLP